MNLPIYVVVRGASLIFLLITIVVGILGLVGGTILFPILTLRKGKLDKTVAPDIVSDNGKVEVRDSAAQAFRSVYKEGNKLNLVVFEEVKYLEVDVVIFNGKKRKVNEYVVELKDGNIFSLPCDAKYFRILVKKINKKAIVKTGYKSFSKVYAILHSIFVGGFSFAFLMLSGYFLFALAKFNPFSNLTYLIVYFAFPLASLLLIPVMYLCDYLGAKLKTPVSVR